MGVYIGIFSAILLGTLIGSMVEDSMTMVSSALAHAEG